MPVQDIEHLAPWRNRGSWHQCEQLCKELIIERIVERPSPVDGTAGRVGQIDQPQLRIRPKPRRHVFPLVRKLRVGGGMVQRLTGESLAIEAVRERGRHVVARIVGIFGRSQRQDICANGRIDERTIGRDPHHDIRLDRTGRRRVASENIGPRTARHDGVTFRDWHQCVVFGVVGDRAHHDVRALNGAAAPQHLVEDRVRPERLHHFSGQPRRTHARLHHDGGGHGFTNGVSCSTTR